MSISLSGSLLITGSIVASGGITGSFSGSATTSSYALTASSVLPLNQTLIVSGSTSITGSLQVTGSIVTTGTITAQTLVVQTVTSSIVYSSGSNIFGNSLTNTQKFTGSVLITGSATFSNNITLTGGYLETPWTNDTRTVWERYNSATYFQRISSNAPSRQLRLESNGAYGNASIVLDGQSNDTVTTTITSDKFVATGAATFSSTISAGTTTITGPDGLLVLQAATVNKSLYLEYKNSAATRRGYMGFGGDSSSAFDISNNEAGDMVFRVNAGTERMRITSGGNVGVGISGVYSDVRFMTRGASATSADYSFRAENSGGSNIIFGRNDGLINTGTLTASPYNNTVTGRAIFVNSSGDLGYVSSTRESKINIEPINNSNIINELNPVSFNYRKKDKNNQYTSEFDDDIFYGLIADEVEKVDSNLVVYNKKEDGTKELKGVYYEKLAPLLIKAIQEQQAQIQSLQEQITELKNR